MVGNSHAHYCPTSKTAAMTGWLDSKRALVVGAGSGIGRAVVDAFTAEGAKVAVLERDSGKCDTLRQQLPAVPVIEGDATSRAANDRAVAATVEAFGGLDTLINCVGIFDFYKGIGDIAADDLDAAFEEMFRTNVLSHLQSVKAAIPALQAEAGSSIVLTESASSFYPDAAACSMCRRSSLYAGWLRRWRTSWHRASGSTGGAGRHAEHRLARTGQPGPGRHPS